MSSYDVGFLRFLCRDLDPATWRSAGLLARVTARGILGDVGWRSVRTEPRPEPGP